MHTNGMQFNSILSFITYAGGVQYEKEIFVNWWNVPSFHGWITVHKCMSNDGYLMVDKTTK